MKHYMKWVKNHLQPLTTNVIKIKNNVKIFTNNEIEILVARLWDIKVHVYDLTLNSLFRLEYSLYNGNHGMRVPVNTCT